MDTPTHGHENKLDKRHILRGALVIFLPLVALSIGVASIIYTVGTRSNMGMRLHEEELTLHLQYEGIEGDLDGIISDLIILSTGSQMDAFLGGRQTDSTSKTDLQDLFQRFSANRTVYDQVRLLDESGMEIIRVNFTDSIAVVVPESDLQDKGSRYYFTDTYRLGQGEVFMSPLDLNIEGGVIERPLKPMIRFGTPVFDSRGQKRGIIVLNYLAVDMLQKIQSLGEHKVGQSMLLNADGYWCLGVEPEDEWGFMFDDRNESTFANSFPDEWQLIRDEDRGQEEFEAGLLTFETVYPLLEGVKSGTGSVEAFGTSERSLAIDEYFWKVVSFLPHEELYLVNRNWQRSIVLILTVLAVVLGFGSWLLASGKTVRNLNEERIRRLSDVVEQAKTPIFITDPDGVIEYINPAFTDITGFTKEDALGETARILNSGQMSKKYYEKVWSTIKSGESISAVVTNKRKNGEIWYYDQTIVPLKDEHGQITGFVSSGKDITKLRNAEHALAKAKRKYQEIVESASDLIFEVDTEGRWTFLNNASKMIYGAPPKDLLGTPFKDRVHPEYMEADMTAFMTVLKGGELRDYETCHIGFDGRERHLSFSVSPVLSEDGRTESGHGTARDVTDRVEVRRALEEARVAAERAAASKAAFLANMSHEIRTPLNGILGMTEILLDTDLTAEQRRSAEIVRDSSDALLSIINDILDYSKIEAGHFSIEEIPFDLQAMIDSVVRPLAIRGFEQGVEVAYDLRPDIPEMVIGDPGRIRQVLNNIIGNAIKFTHEGEVVLTISLADEEEVGRRREASDRLLVSFSVRDTGIGIPEEKIELIFGEFAQADESTTRKYGGTGLGLAITKSLIDLMEGDLAVESEMDVGSTFSFAIPLEIPEEVEAHPPLIGRLSLKGVRALVVDDNSTNRRIVCELLEAEGIKTEQTESGEEALEELRSKVGSERPYQLAVIDAYMPGLDGFQLAEEVGKDEQFGELKLLMLTSGAKRGDGQRCRELGITGYLTKPVSRSDFIQTTIAVLTETERTQGILITRHTVEETRMHQRVLLVEDVPVNQEVALTLLTKRGHEVDVANNGEEAIEMVMEGDYDVVLMDIQMPVKDGITATSEIRAMQEYEGLPIVALTAHALEGDAERFIAAGMNGFISKPFKSHELFAAVEGWGIDTSDEPEEVEVEPQETEPKPVDLDSFKASMREAGAEDAVEAMLKVFIDDAPGRIEALESAVAAEDTAAVASASHAFKSGSGTIGANGLAELLKESELAGEAGDIDKATGLLERIRPLYELVMEQLRTELEG